VVHPRCDLTEVVDQDLSDTGGGNAIPVDQRGSRVLAGVAVLAECAAF
jgi:hypothetical protein